jgi:hypothetical protein
MNISRYFSSLFLFFLISGENYSAFARVESTADILEKGSKKKIFTIVRDVNLNTAGFSEIKTTYSDTEGTIVFEEVSLTKGATLLKTEINQKQTDEKAVIEVLGKDVSFKLTSPDGKTTEKKEKLPELFVSAVTFDAFVRANWSALLKGETVNFRYAVWARQETVGFKIFKESESLDSTGAKSIVIKMKPSSILIAALVKPLMFYYNSDGSQLLSYDGRVSPKIKNGKKWDDLDAEVFFSYPVKNK